MSLHELFSMLGGGVLGWFYGMYAFKKIDAHYAYTDERFQNWKTVVPAILIAVGISALGHAMAATGFIMGIFAYAAHHGKQNEKQ